MDMQVMRFPQNQSRNDKEQHDCQDHESILPDDVRHDIEIRQIAQYAESCQHQNSCCHVVEASPSANRFLSEDKLLALTSVEVGELQTKDVASGPSQLIVEVAL